MKGLINIKIFDNNCFLWCHVRYLNLDGVKLCRITKKDRAFVKKLNYGGVNFPVSKKDYGKIEVLNGINVNVFCYENKLVYHVYLSNQSFNGCMDLLLVSSDFTSHYVYIKDFNRLMFKNARYKGKKYFCKSCLQCFSSEKVLKEHKEDCLMIHGKQNVKLEKGFIEFKNINKQILAPFKIYADFKCLSNAIPLKGCDVCFDNKCFSYTRKYQDHISCSVFYKVACVDNKFSKDVVLYRRKNAVSKFIMSILKEYDYCKSVIKKHFNKNLVMTAEENEEFERTNICWICDKLIAFNENVIDHCHSTGKYRGAAHWFL